MQISFVLGGAGGAPCKQTAHFSSVSEQLTPPTRSSCPPSPRRSLRVPVRGAARLFSRAAACLTDLAALAEDLERGDGCLLAHLPDPLVVEPFDGLAKRRQPVAAAVRHFRRVKDSLGLVSSQGDRVGGILDQPELDRIGDGPRLLWSLRRPVRVPPSPSGSPP
jgi:hypothetical protein